MLHYIKRFYRTLLLGILLLSEFLCPLQSYADGHTVLTASVPSSIELDVVLDGHGSITVDGHHITNPTTISVDRLAEISVSVHPVNTYSSITVMLDGKKLPISTINRQTTFITPGIDGILEVVFRQGTPPPSSNPKTGDVFFAPAVLVCILSAFTLLSLIGIKTNKRRHKK